MGYANNVPVNSNRSGTTSVDGATIITIPAGAGFWGTVELAACLATGSLAGVTKATPTITVQGNPVGYNSGDVLAALSLATPLLLAGVIVPPVADNVTIPVVVIAGSGGCTLQLNYGGASSAVAVASGPYTGV